MVSEADEAAGLSPGNEKNEAERYFSPEKPCLPLSIEGSLIQLKYHNLRQNGIPNFILSQQIFR